MTRGSIVSLGIANPVFRPNADEEGVYDNDGFVDHEKVDVGLEKPGDTEKTVDGADSAPAPPTELKASLNLGHAVSLAVGQTIGSGIFVSPNDVVKQVGSIGMSLVIWLISGTLSMCGALTFCELGTMFKRSGGEYQYIKAAYGKLAAFLYLWVCGVIRNGMGCAAIALTFAHYFMDLFMDEKDPGFTVAKKSAATAAIVIIIAVNIWSTKIGLWMQNIFTALKLGALSVLVIMGIYFLAAGKTENISKNWFEGTDIDFAKWTNAFFASLWAYSGWNCINMMSGEIKNPTKTVPRALVLTNIIMISIYLIANIAYHTILPLSTLRNERAIAVKVGKVVLGEGTWGRVGEVFFGVSVAISTFGALSSSLMGSSRLPFIAAQEDMFPKFVALIQVKNGTPIVGLLTMGTLATFWVWPIDIGGLIKYVGFLSWAWWGMCFAAVPLLRFTMRGFPRTFRVFLPVTGFAIIASLYLTIGQFVASPVPCLGWLAVVAVGVPIYYGFVDPDNTCRTWMAWLLSKLSKLLKAEL
ncbi:hypothetical protein ACHWQZ_G000188 [Mnemiopsis leidyi]